MIVIRSADCLFVCLELKLKMVVLRRRQVACIRMGLLTFLIGAGLVFVYHYVDNNDYQKQMEDAISILERDTSKFGTSKNSEHRQIRTFNEIGTSS